MSWNPFSVEVLRDGSDEEIGKLLIGTWIYFQAEERGIDEPANPPPEFSALVVKLSRELDTDDLTKIPLAKALVLGCSGEWARAGAIVRGLVMKGGLQIQITQLAQLGRGLKVRQRRAAGLGAVRRSRGAKEDRNLWRKVGGPLRDKHPNWSNSRLATEICRHSSVKAMVNTVRLALPGLGLSVKPKKVDR